MRTNFPNKELGKRLLCTYYPELKRTVSVKKVLVSSFVSFPFILVVSFSSWKSRKYCRGLLRNVFAVAVSFLVVVSHSGGENVSAAIPGGGGSSVKSHSQVERKLTLNSGTQYFKPSARNHSTTVLIQAYIAKII